MSRRFQFHSTPLAGLVVLEHLPQVDGRGYFERLFCARELQALGLETPILQINRSRTAKAGTIRGMHFQHPPHNEAKIISCLQGEVFDVAVDLRRGSPTFLRWYGQILSADNHKSVYLPEGFAHGFQSLTDECDMLYFHTQSFCPEAAGGLSPFLPELGISWPLPVTEVSEKDRSRPLSLGQFQGIDL